MQSATCSDYIHFGFVLFQIHLHFTFPCCDLNAVTCHLPMYGVLVSDSVQSHESVVHLAGCLPHSSTITINFWFIWQWVVSSADSLATKFVPSSSSLLIAPGLFRFHNHFHNYLWVCSSSLCLSLPYQVPISWYDHWPHGHRIHVSVYHQMRILFPSPRNSYPCHRT